jgi:hypothetical protein
VDDSDVSRLQHESSCMAAFYSPRLGIKEILSGSDRADYQELLFRSRPSVFDILPPPGKFNRNMFMLLGSPTLGST